MSYFLLILFSFKEIDSYSTKNILTMLSESRCLSESDESQNLDVCLNLMSRRS